MNMLTSKNININVYIKFQNCTYNFTQIVDMNIYDANW